MLRAIHATGVTVSLAAGTGENEINRSGHIEPVRQMQILADVGRARVIGSVDLDSQGPVVCGPDHGYAGLLRRSGETA
jgi:hypothetical protein